jgi:transcriptional regulator with XRE-family HTH domain
MKVSYTKEILGLGEKIRELRKNSPFSITHLAASAGISVPYWNRIENEKVGQLPIETLRAIEKALGTDFGVDLD